MKRILTNVRRAWEEMSPAERWSLAADALAGFAVATTAAAAGYWFGYRDGRRA